MSNTADFPGFSPEQIRAGLTTPVILDALKDREMALAEERAALLARLDQTERELAVISDALGFPKLRPPSGSETGTVRLGDCAITYKR